MYGSLSEFLDVQKKVRFSNLISQQINPIRSISQQKHNRQNILVYETQDKTIYLHSISSKQKSRQKIAQQKLKQALQQRVIVKKSQKQHWIQSKHMQSSNLSSKNKLLRAIAKTREMQSQDNSKTYFERSFGRITSAYSKIKTLSIDVLLPPKMIEIEQIVKSQQKKIPLHKKSCPVSPNKMLNLQNSVKWAKKHGKNFNSFYQELGKSYELIQYEKPGKNNYQLQKQAKIKEEESKRRFVRRKFLKLIQRRLSKNSDLRV